MPCGVPTRAAPDARPPASFGGRPCPISTRLQARAVADPAWFWAAAADDLGLALAAPPDLGPRRLAGCPVRALVERRRVQLRIAAMIRSPRSRPDDAASPGKARMARPEADAAGVESAVDAAAAMLAAEGVGRGHAGRDLPADACSRPSSPCSRSAVSGRSSRRSSRAMRRPRSRPGCARSRRRTSSRPTASTGAATSSPLKRTADEAVVEAPDVRRVVVVRRLLPAGRRRRRAVRPGAGSVVARGHRAVGRPAARLTEAGRHGPRNAVHGHLHLGHDRARRRARSTSTAASRSRRRRTWPTASTSGRRRPVFWFTDLGWMMGPWLIAGGLCSARGSCSTRARPTTPGRTGSGRSSSGIA